MQKTTALSTFHPVVQRWFEETLGEPSEPQIHGWPAIRSANQRAMVG